MKRKLLPLILLLFTLLFSAQVFAADTVVVDGLTYRLRDDGTAMLTRCSDALVDKLPSTIVVPEQVYGYTVTQVDDVVFNSITTIERIELPDTVVSIGESCFNDCTGLKSIKLPKNASIGTNTFEDCTALEELTVPEGNVYLDYYFCKNCTSLKSVTFPEGLKTLGTHAFENCSQLSEISFPSTLTGIGSESFKNCSSLTEVVLPEGVAKLHMAFIGCTALKTVHLPASLTEPMYQCFICCPSLETITVAEGNPKYHMQDNMLMSNEQELVLYPAAKAPKELTLPDSVKTIGKFSFNSCSNLTSVTLPEGLESIGFGAFVGCSGLTGIAIPESVTTLESQCVGYLNYSKAIPGFTIYGYPDSAAYRYAAGNKFRFVSLDPDQDEPTPTFVPVSELTYEVYSASVVITGAKGDISSYTTLAIPDTIDGKPVTEIAELAFFWNAPANVIIPDSVRRIGDSAFENNPGLKSITFPKAVDFMGLNVCTACPDLTKVTLPENLKVIPWGMFEDCSSLAEIKLPETVTQISDYAFEGCSALTGVSLPESVTYLGGCAFAGCKSMEELWLPAGVSVIGQRAFGYTVTGEPIEGQYLVLYPAAAHLAAANEIPYQLLPFSDDTQTGTWKWASDAIYDCVAAGVIRGYPDNTFLADKSVSRVEFVSMLYGVYGLMELDLPVESHPFTDARSGWYRDALNWAYTYEIVSGTGKTTFSPNKPISRQEMATILYRFINTFFEAPDPTGQLLSQYTDAGQVASYARTPMEFCLENGILYGTSDTKLSPLGTATRAQAAAVIARSFFAD